MAKQSKGKNKKQAPPQAEPLNFVGLMNSANAGAAESAAAQTQATMAAYPDMERLQLGTIAKIRDSLNNNYTSAARNSASQLGGLGSWMAGNARDTYASSGPTSIEAELYRQAESDLALGRSLNPAEIRDAQQSARAAMSSRGLGASQSTTAAEILNRDSYAQARESARRNFAGAANDMQLKNVLARRDQAGQQASLGSNMLGNSAQMLTGIDPYARALGSAGIGQGINNGLNQMVGTTYGNALGFAGDVASMNANMLDSRYNSYMNNQAALQAARMQTSAMNRAGTMGMLGSALQSGIQAGGLIGAAQFAPAMFSDRRMKKDIKPLGKAGSILGLTAYEYKYNGDDKKRVGFMAQDVQKVLPEAVIEVEHNGQKRLAIKPAVIGAAIAEELMAVKAA